MILGAGASFDCADIHSGGVNVEYRPPLVRNLFEDNSAFNPILAKYPKVSALAGMLRNRLASGEGLEDVLREFSQVTELPRRKQYRQVPLYLQELLGEVGEHFIGSGGTAYNQLVWDLEGSKYERIIYVTLNYDLFLERALETLYDVTFDSMEAYTNYPRWTLVKPHGSVLWGREVLNAKPVTGTAAQVLDVVDEDLRLADEITILKTHHDVGRLGNGRIFYPALSIPEGGKELFSCPPSHLETLTAVLPNCQDFLVIGFSGLDTHVLRLLKTVRAVNNFAIVNGSGQAAAETLGRFAQQNGLFNRGVCLASDSGFTAFLEQRHFKTFLERR